MTGRAGAGTGLPFHDRVAAGAALAEALDQYRARGALVLGLIRGGVPVAAEVARRLEAELDIVVVRKLGAPAAPELAMGAVTSDGTRILNNDVVKELRVPDAQLVALTEARGIEALRLEEQLRRGRPDLRIRGRTVILVDDGLATGATMRAAVASVRRRVPGRIVVAVPVGSKEACAALRREADEVVCPVEPEWFDAVGSWYEDFAQVSDREVTDLLDRLPPRPAG
jgi:predicted phosphoribosyltransferase